MAENAGKSVQQHSRFTNRAAEEVKEAVHGRVAKAKKAGPHGSSTSADGTPYLQPLNKGKVAKLQQD